MLTWPWRSLSLLVWLVAIGLVLSGVSGLLTASMSPRPRLALLIGFVWVLTAAVAVAWPGVTLWALAVTVALGLITGGCLKVVAALSGDGEERVVLGLSGLTNVVVGILAGRVAVGHGARARDRRRDSYDRHRHEPGGARIASPRLRWRADVGAAAPPPVGPDGRRRPGPGSRPRWSCRQRVDPRELNRTNRRRSTPRHHRCPTDRQAPSSGPKSSMSICLERRPIASCTCRRISRVPPARSVASSPCPTHRRRPVVVASSRSPTGPWASHPGVRRHCAPSSRRRSASRAARRSSTRGMSWQLPTTKVSGRRAYTRISWARSRP